MAVASTVRQCVPMYRRCTTSAVFFANKYVTIVNSCYYNGSGVRRHVTTRANTTTTTSAQTATSTDDSTATTEAPTSWFRNIWDRLTAFGRNKYRNNERVFNASKKLCNIILPFGRRVEFYTHCKIPQDYPRVFALMTYHVWVSSIPLRMNGEVGKEVMDSLLHEIMCRTQKELERLGESGFLISKRAREYQQIMYGNFVAYDKAVEQLNETKSIAPFVGVVWRNIYGADEAASLPHVVWFCEYALSTLDKMVTQTDPKAVLAGDLVLPTPPFCGPSRKMPDIKSIIAQHEITIEKLKEGAISGEYRKF